MTTQRRWLRHEVISALTDADLPFFTLSDLETHLGMTQVQAKKTAERLLRANQARRVQRGLYELVDPADWRHQEAPYTSNWYITAARLAGGRPYFLAYYTAMDLHNMLEHPLLTVYVATTVQKGQVVIAPARFRFIKVAENRLFGFEDREVAPGERVNVATLERTFIDCVDRPQLCGGLEQIVSGFRRRHNDLGPEKLLNLLYQLDEPTAIKRIGFLLEAVGHPDPMLLEELERMSGRLGRYVPLIPGTLGTQGKWRSKRWEVEVGVPRQTLQAIGVT